MHIQTLDFNLNQPITRTVSLPPFSDGAVGIKVYRNGEALAANAFDLKLNGETQTAEEGLVNGYVVYKLTTQNAARLYSVTTDTGSFPLVVTIQPTTVYEKADGSALTPATADTLGGVKVGSGLSVTTDGTLSASGGGGGTTIKTVQCPANPQTDRLDLDAAGVQLNDYFFVESFAGWSGALCKIRFNGQDIDLPESEWATKKQANSLCRIINPQGAPAFIYQILGNGFKTEYTGTPS